MQEIINYFQNGITKNWQLKLIKNIVNKYQSGGTPSRKKVEYWEGGNIPFAVIEDMTKSGLYIYKTKQYITPKGLHNSSAWIVPPDAVLLSMYASIGKTSINKIPLTTNQEIIALILKEEYNNIYVALCLEFFKNLLIFQTIESTQKNINKAIVGNFLIPLPPLQEQQKIAAVLSLVQNAIAQQEQLITLTTELKKALMHKLFTEGTRGEPQKMTEIGLIPESWDVIPLSKFCQFLSGGTPSKQQSLYWDGDIPWVSPKDMKSSRLSKTIDYITSEGLENGSKLAPKNSILIVVRGMILAKNIPIALLESPMAFNQDIKALVSEHSITNEFLLYSLQSRKDNLLSLVGTSAHGTKTLLTGELQSFKIAKPSDCEQKEIVFIFKQLEYKIKLYKEKKLIFIFKDLFRNLLHQLMTAQIRVDDLNLSALNLELQETNP